jgi:flagellar basal-body rod protein FlgB
MNIFRAVERMGAVLDLRAAQHRVISSNIANEETPGYRAKEVNFKDTLAAVRQDAKSVTMHITNNRHLMLPSITTQVSGRIAEVPAADLPLDANSVNLDLEMAKLSDNAMQYNATAELLARRFRGLLRVIREGQ